MVSLPITVSGVRKAVTRLRTLNVSPHEDGFYHAITHPTALDALRGDTAWTTWNQYSRPEKMERGLMGEVEGVKFYDDPNCTTQAYTRAGTGVSTIGSSFGTVYGTLIFGRGAYAVTELEGAGTGDNAAKIYTTPRDTPDKADPLHQFGYVGYKITAAAKILNASCGVILLTNI
jgi:N4-gp56 family major capsid protein